MNPCGSRQDSTSLGLNLILLSGFFANLAEGDVCSCQQYGCNPCPASATCTKTNVALNKSASASRLYNTGGPPCLAVNGDTGTTFRDVNMNPNNPACVHTDPSDHYPYWEVDLGQQYNISTITVYGREESWNTLRNAIVTVDDQPCYTFAPNYFRPFITQITCSSSLTGRTVRIKKVNDNDKPYFAVCQVQVWVCKSGYYDPNCANTCGNCSGGTCDTSSGECPQGCSAGYQSPYCNKTCSSGSYGLNCSYKCGNCSKGTTCNPVSGQCLSGCNPGYQLTYCNSTCTGGTYGAGCTQTCGNCTDKRPCNIFDGSCETGCLVGYKPPLCKEVCDSGKYGLNCSYTCGNCSEGTTCNAVSGECPRGCKPGYQGTYCNSTCTRGTHGAGCNQTCGKCVAGNECNIFTGVCENGCEAGYYPPLCSLACTNRSYGINCSNTCGNCSSGTPCLSDSGVCTHGCSAGYQRPHCKETCKSKTYGVNCSLSCGYCDNSSDCDIYNGTCTTCASKFLPPYCKDCIGGYYGASCNKTCGHCKNNTLCHPRTGLCPGGCDGSWQGDNCEQEALASPENNTGNTGVIAGVTVPCIIILIIAIVVASVFIIRRRQTPKYTGADNAAYGRETKSSKQQTSQQETTSLSSIPLSSKTSVGKEKERPSVAVKPTVMKMSRSGEDGAKGVKPKSQKKNHGTTADIPCDLEDESDHTYRNDESVYATFKATRPQLDNVQQTLIDLLASGHLTDRFQELPKGLTDEHEAAKLPTNIKKNRYYSVLPYDKNRVVLTDGFTEGQATDYINASYISGFHQQKTYIATQGPRDNTVGDFWRMVWQEQITQIIMLTSLVEDGKNKCCEYWPARDSSETYGPVTVTCADVQRRANFFIRKFIIETRSSREKREVEQLNFVAWPDHGVPTTTSLLNFWRFAKSRAPQPPPPPVLVHCTAGVGRTGAYIGLDIAYEVAVSGGDVHVYDVVKRMREERCIMVQAAEQFVFLHKAVLEAYTGRDTVIPSDRFNTIFPQTVRALKEHPRIDHEFKKVMQMRSLTPDLSVKVATEASNKAKIRHKTFLPADNHLVYLTANVPGREHFINAVYMSTYRDYKGSILTQLPFEDTLVDFWRLVDGCDVQTIVSLGSQKEPETVKDYCKFWPMNAGTSLTVDPYVIRHKSTFPLGSHLLSYTLSLEKKKEPGCRQVQLLHYTAWAGELPDDMTDLLGLMDKVDALCLQDNHPAPVIIQCHDGVTRSGMFSTLWNVLSRLTSDKDIDVYMAVRETHSVTPHAVTSLEQYRYCYEVVQKRVSDMNIYTNTDTSTDMNIYTNADTSTDTNIYSNI